MFRIAIVDDNPEMLETVQSYAKQTLNELEVEIEIFFNPLALLFKVQGQQTFELYLLDIEMPSLDGLSLAKEIRKQQKRDYIAFVTSHTEFALASYDTDIKADYYIQKSHLVERLPSVLREVKAALESVSERNYLIETKVRLEKITCNSIVHIYKEGKNAVIVTAQGEHRERKTLERLYEDLQSPEFIFIERGQIVNIDHIQAVKGNSVHLDNGTCLEISRTNIQSIKRKVSQYWKERL